jgi:PPK2 family polyphosphate:nucleotide phosphotransferase
MPYHEQFRVTPGSQVRLTEVDPTFSGTREKKKTAQQTSEDLQERLKNLQFQLYAEGQRSLLVVLQALDAGGKDGVIRHVIDALNPQGCRVMRFREPTSEELAHDFLWRIEPHMPRRGEAAILNRSHYEDILVGRVRQHLTAKVINERLGFIADFERRLAANGTQILKFFLHISKDEQLRRFGKRLDDPLKQWKISEADYTDRERWDDYQQAYGELLSTTSTAYAPWFIIPADHKWFRNLAISQIIVKTLENMHLQVPTPTVDLDEIRTKYHQQT